MSDLSGYQINIGAVKIVEKWPAHLTLKGGRRGSPWEKFFDGAIHEVQIPSAAMNKSGKLPLWQSTMGAIKQASYAWAKREHPGKKSKVEYMYDEANGRLYFRVILVDRKTSEKTKEN